MPQWTKEQEQAIYTSGTDTLVAAAAGSGKTAVLVERIIQKLIDKQNPVAIDTLLVVTFTNAAAQEMRNRVAEALESALEVSPESAHLRKQLALLQQASISTLHAFCMDLIRRNAYLLDIDPSFRIADSMEADLLRQEVLDDLFEDWYGREANEQQAFFTVVDSFSSDRSDEEVEELILKLYDFAMQNPWPEEWLDQIVEMYAVTPETKETDISWLAILKKDVYRQLNAMQNEAKQALEKTRENDGPYQYADAIDADLLMIQEAKAKLDISWEDTRTHFIEGKFKALSRKKVECSEEKKEQVKAIRNKYKKRWNELSSNWFSRKLAAYLADMQALYPLIKELVALVKAFKTSYTALKKEKALVDFSDLEHYCLQLLLAEEATSDNIIPSDVAEALQHKFTEVLVDEYQDTNLVQETILSLVSKKDPGNLFMVGDVKQSIYRFRHAEPSLFIEKYKEFADTSNHQKRIDLARNFRSRQEVLAAANYIFRQLLDEEVGEITYDQDAELIYGNLLYDQLPLANPNTEVVVINRDTKEVDQATEDDETLEDLEKAQIEARAYANRIQRWIGNKDQESMKVMDKSTGQKRSLQYRDIVILMRSMTWAPTIMEELKKQGIPVYAEIASGYLEAIEIKVMISLLRIIDNPQQDIPLASVLRSPIVGLDENDLAEIRLAKKRVSYFEALRVYQNTVSDPIKQKQLTTFLTQLEVWRKQARQEALAELIWQIYRDTGYYDFVGGMPGGRQRQANLRALYDRARAYEATSFRGLFRFLRLIDRMEENGDDLGAARALGESEDVVRIMTIHKSKGLEFPVVILGAMDKQFNQQDLKRKYLLHKDLGFASKYIDPEKRIMYPTLIYHALKQQMKQESWAEEMRVLYVALTRAKEKLVMIGSVASLEKKLAKWQEVTNHPEWVLPAHYRLETNTYLDWVASSLIRHKQATALRNDEPTQVSPLIVEDVSKWDIQVEHANTYRVPTTEVENGQMNVEQKIREWQPISKTDESLDEKVERRLTFSYPYNQAASYRAKQTVTEIKRQREVKDIYSDTQLIKDYKAPITRRPSFMQKEQKLRAAEVGTAMHTVMQQLPFVKKWKEEEIKEAVQEMVTREVLTQNQADAIDVKAIAAFFKTDIAADILQSEEIHREVPFSLTLKAEEVYSNWTTDEEERVFIQGVIDLIVPTLDGWMLIDYKTDQIQEHTEESILIERYRIQLNLYAKALAEIWKQPVVKKYLYFFSNSKLIEITD
ncbi:ATP-dependent helicase/nuclease subunit A [Paraliobacillus sp. PM-2]|uniref:helicase-exonuclease AddAB subunit AddA n=1 Tax=Paraliobacillus sp. PM-2 TaxID=1462524 RepID=UPI00061C442F|nr:helicase-exonuclease AddAB subunit AddA [Paraliobacillus sp. PM-2]CQR47015.1 ATP-dependent helicase/nuclease subunit A [Paraliobacillus sp. PM-2]